MKKIIIAAGLATALFASPFEVTPTATYVVPEGNLDLKSQLAAGLRFGYNFDYALLTKIEVGGEYAWAKYKVDGVDAERTGITRYFVNAIKEYNITPKLALYGLIGAGYEDISNPKYDNKDSGFGQYGAGLRYALTDALSLRAEARHGIKFRNTDNNFFGTLGFTYRFGVKAPEVVAPVVAAAPVVEAVVAPAPKPAPAPAPVYGDADNDGVTDDKDLCPNTPAGQQVDAVGCVKVIALKVNFAFDKDVIESDFDNQIQKVADVLNSEKDYTVRLEGNTDSTGPAAYNLGLSERRVKAVANRLIELGVAASRITTEWYGETRPVADNSTPAGRAENRRVDTTFAK